ncbi:crAss001_48 related protein [Intestinibacter sp.]|uniref:crAss001_48 related protein n=1 Tax=Intestinibacter sp. TaxID=1965304 RepID=UPI002A765C19|nr:hypothetical protein [Intestinibacter sp.]MDY2736061.1 hypothetical protein [Intestinibacter sp.]
MELKNTVDLMLSKDFKDRFKAEYYQLKDRTEKLEKMLYGYRNNTLKFKPKCSYELLDAQLSSMKTYLNILKERAKIENISL